MVVGEQLCQHLDTGLIDRPFDFGNSAGLLDLVPEILGC